MANDSETWVKIKGYENEYEVSDKGRIRGLDRKTRGWSVLGKMLHPSVNNYGYQVVNLRKGGKSKTWLVHRLVAIAFLENKIGYKDVDHINRDISNNTVTNLRWASRSLNNNNSDRSSKRSSQFTGVVFEKSTGKWKVTVYDWNKRITIGRYDSEIYAAFVYDRECNKRELDRVRNF